MALPLPKPAGLLAKPQPAQQPSSGRGVLACIIGRPGVGKSSVLGMFPNCTFICDPRDQGILDLIDYGKTTGISFPRNRVIVASDFNTFIRDLKLAIASTAQTIVCESIVGIQALCEDHCFINDYKSDAFKFANFQNGSITSANVYFQQIIDYMIAGQNAGKNMFLTGHTKIGSGGKAVVGEDWVAQTMDCSPAMARRIEASFANIFNIGLVVNVEKIGGKQKVGTHSLKLFTTFNPLFPAKNRMGLTEDYDLPSTAKGTFDLVCKLMALNPATGVRL